MFHDIEVTVFRPKWYSFNTNVKMLHKETGVTVEAENFDKAYSDIKNLLDNRLVLTEEEKEFFYNNAIAERGSNFSLSFYGDTMIYLADGRNL